MHSVFLLFLYMKEIPHHEKTVNVCPSISDIGQNYKKHILNQCGVIYNLKNLCDEKLQQTNASGFLCRNRRPNLMHTYHTTQGRLHISKDLHPLQHSRYCLDYNVNIMLCKAKKTLLLCSLATTLGLTMLVKFLHNRLFSHLNRKLNSISGYSVCRVCFCFRQSLV